MDDDHLLHCRWLHWTGKEGPVTVSDALGVPADALDTSDIDELSASTATASTVTTSAATTSAATASTVTTSTATTAGETAQRTDD